MTQVLLNGRFAPATYDIGFIKIPAADAAREFIEWQKPIQERRRVSLESTGISGTLERLVESLAPLTSVERRRHLFVPTSSDWCAYFDNGWRGGDPASVVSVLCEKYAHSGVRAMCVPHAPDSSCFRSFGAVIFETYGPKGLPVLNTERSVFVANNGSKWEFGEEGEPLPFEDLQAYKNRVVRDRFTPRMLQDYLHHLHIDLFNPDFYRAKSNELAILIEKNGPSAKGMQEYRFDDLRICE